MSDPDPVTGLTSVENELIRESWAMLSKDQSLADNGVELLIQLLSTYPYMAEYFPTFKGISASDLRNDQRFINHSTKVMKAIGQEVDCLDDPEAMVQVVKKVAGYHVKHHLKIKEFENLKEMFVPFLKFVMGSHCTDAVASSWTKLLTVQNAVIKEVFEKAT